MRTEIGLASPKEVYENLQKPWNQIRFVNQGESKIIQEYIRREAYYGIDCELLKLKTDAVLNRRMLAAATGVALGLSSQVGALSELSPIAITLLGLCSLGSFISNKILDRAIQNRTGSPSIK